MHSSTLLGPTRRSFAAAFSDERPPGPDPNAAHQRSGVLAPIGGIKAWTTHLRSLISD